MRPPREPRKEDFIKQTIIHTLYEDDRLEKEDLIKMDFTYVHVVSEYDYSSERIAKTHFVKVNKFDEDVYNKAVKKYEEDCKKFQEHQKKLREQEYLRLKKEFE